VLEAPGNSAQNRYVQAASLNGAAYNKNWISHFDIQKGGKFSTLMGVAPNKNKGTSKEAYPYSFSTGK